MGLPDGYVRLSEGPDSGPDSGPEELKALQDFSEAIIAWIASRSPA